MTHAFIWGYSWFSFFSALFFAGDRSRIHFKGSDTEASGPKLYSISPVVVFLRHPLERKCGRPAFEKPAVSTVKICNYFICDIRCIRRHLNLDASTVLANALVSSRVDYCNSLLHSIPKVHLNKLQRVQNSLARIVTKSTRFTSSKSLLKPLHWLPIASRINFKIATLTYKAVHLKQSPSLAKYLRLKPMHFNTRNNEPLFLQHPQVGTNSYGHRAFCYTAPTVWSKVPYYIRNAPSVVSLRKQLKTYYFGHLSRPPDGCVMSCPEVL